MTPIHEQPLADRIASAERHMATILAILQEGRP